MSSDVKLPKMLVQHCKCDGCRQERKCVYVPELEEWICHECLNMVCNILTEGLS